MPISDVAVKRCSESVPITRPVTTLMTIGAQGYSIGDAIRTLLGEVAGLMCFKKWPFTVHKKALNVSGLYGAAWFRNQSQLSAPPVWYSITRVSKKFFSFFKSMISLIHGNGLVVPGYSSFKPICDRRRFAMNLR